MQPSGQQSPPPRRGSAGHWESHGLGRGAQTSPQDSPRRRHQHTGLWERVGPEEPSSAPCPRGGQLPPPLKSRASPPVAPPTPGGGTSLCAVLPRRHRQDGLPGTSASSGLSGVGQGLAAPSRVGAALTRLGQHGALAGVQAHLGCQLPHLLGSFRKHLWGTGWGQGARRGR